MDLVKPDHAQLLLIECLFSWFAETYPPRSRDLVRSDNGTEFNPLGTANMELGFEWSRSSPINRPVSGVTVGAR